MSCPQVLEEKGEAWRPGSQHPRQTTPLRRRFGGEGLAVDPARPLPTLPAGFAAETQTKKLKPRNPPNLEPVPVNLPSVLVRRSWSPCSWSVVSGAAMATSPFSPREVSCDSADTSRRSVREGPAKEKQQAELERRLDQRLLLEDKLTKAKQDLANQQKTAVATEPTEEKTSSEQAPCEPAEEKTGSQQAPYEPTEPADSPAQEPHRKEEVPDYSLKAAQRPCVEGLFCLHYGRHNCRKWLSSVWSYKQHLASKHGMPKNIAHEVAGGQWQQLEAAFGVWQKRERPETSPVPVNLQPRDSRRPNEPAFPPKGAELGPAQKQPRRDAETSSASLPSNPGDGEASSSSKDAGIELLRAMWSDVADRVLKRH